MSDEKKLSDDLDDLLGDAKEGVKKAAEKAEEFAKEAKEKATEFAGEAKEKASEFAEEAKEALNDGGGKGVAIIAHLWWIGWIIALIMNNSNKTELGSFYIRQTLGIFLLSFFSTSAKSLSGKIHFKLINNFFLFLIDRVEILII